MVYHQEFATALEQFRLSGGAMLYHGPDNNSAECWAVSTYEDIAENATCSPREATELALEAGGLSAKEIAAELVDWHEEIE